MNNSPLVSIITPYYNSDKYISETVESVIKQTYQNWEHIIVDDGSSDESFAFLEQLSNKDARIKICKRNRLPKGRSTSRNIGIEKSEGKYIIFLDSDDLLYPHCLEQRVKVMEEGLYDFVVFQMEMFLPDGHVKDLLSTIDSSNYLQSFLSYHHPWNIACPIWNNAFFKEKIGGFVESLSRLEDPEMHTRALMIDNVLYKVYSDREFIDSAYRVDYKPISLFPTLESAIYYINYFYQQIQNRADKNDCLHSLSIYYETIVSHYSGQSKEEVYENIDNMKNINNTFFSLHIIDRNKYKKTKTFLYLLKHRVFEYKMIVSILNGLGYKNFYYFVFKDFCNNTKQ